jgi:hypothetical protein
MEIKMSYPRKSILNVTIVYNSGNYDDNERMFVLRIVDATDECALSEKVLNDEKISSVTLLPSAIANEIDNRLNAISVRLQLMQRHFHSLKNIDQRMKSFMSVGVFWMKLQDLIVLLKFPRCDSSPKAEIDQPSSGQGSR